MRSRQVKAALTLWRSLAENAGLDPSIYHPARRWVRRNPERDRIVIRLEAEGREAGFLKAIFAPYRPRRAAARFRSQAEAHHVLAPVARVHVPRILATDRARQAALMTAAPGTTLREQYEEGAALRLILQRAGRWLAAYHHATRLSDAPFSSPSMTTRLGNAASDHGRAVPEGLNAATDRPTPVAACHGDPTANNLISAGGEIWAVDFTGAPPGPVVADVARLLLDIASHWPGPVDADPMTVLGQDIPGPFFGTYDLVRPEDPTLRVVLQAQLQLDYQRRLRKQPEGARTQTLASLVRSVFVQ